MLKFLRTEYPSKAFMPALGVKRATFHHWGDCGYIHLDRPGTGKAVVLTGEEILHAACLAILSKTGGNSKFMVRGLRDCVAFYRGGIGKWTVSFDEKGNVIMPDKEPDTYAVFRYVERCTPPHVAIDAEWSLSHNPTDDRPHITEAFGHKAAPYFQAINLTELLRDLVLKIDGRKV